MNLVEWNNLEINFFSFAFGLLAKNGHLDLFNFLIFPYEYLRFIFSVVLLFLRWESLLDCVLAHCRKAVSASSLGSLLLALA